MREWLDDFRTRHEGKLRIAVILLAAYLLAVPWVGMPHVGGDYVCNHRRIGNAPCESVKWCAYYGLQGRRLDYPDTGEQCQVIKFLPVDWEALRESLWGE